MKNRKDYWNEEYAKYWIDRVKESNNDSKNNSTIILNDVKPASDILLVNAIKKLNIKKEDTVIELGVGFGRSLPYLHKLAKSIIAIDISNAMIKEAKKNTSYENVTFFVGSCEKTEFEKNTFDIGICFGVFDALYQTDALNELNRICKVGAKVLVTGKNDNYHDNDSLALDAEIGARKKNHPNYFTDTKKLLSLINDFGFEIIDSKFFELRGDFAKNHYKKKILKKFYEYQFILKKISDNVVPKEEKISSKYSKTFLSLKTKNINS